MSDKSNAMETCSSAYDVHKWSLYVQLHNYSYILVFVMYFWAERNVLYPFSSFSLSTWVPFYFFSIVYKIIPFYFLVSSL
jgi:hypothetical protein